MAKVIVKEGKKFPVKLKMSRKDADMLYSLVSKTSGTHLLGVFRALLPIVRHAHAVSPEDALIFLTPRGGDTELVPLYDTAEVSLKEWKKHPITLKLSRRDACVLRSLVGSTGGTELQEVFNQLDAAGLEQTHRASTSVRIIPTKN